MSVRDKDVIAWVALLTELGVKPQTAARWAPVCAGQLVAANFSRGWDEIDDFLAQVLVESGNLERTEENLNYSSPSRLVAVWPRRFPNEGAALAYVNNPQGLAAKVYDNRVDLGNTQPGDGWRYRGRSLIQVTGRANYKGVGELIGEPLLQAPEILSSPRVAMKAAIAWWESRIPDKLIGNPELISRRVNGGDNGLKQRVALARLAAQLV